MSRYPSDKSLIWGLRLPHHKRMVNTLRGKRTPLEGAGQLPALLLNQGSLPFGHQATGERNKICA